jgi:hypothetical protein
VIRPASYTPYIKNGWSDGLKNKEEDKLIANTLCQDIEKMMIKKTEESRTKCNTVNGSTPLFASSMLCMISA